MTTLDDGFQRQQFSNGYELVDGVAMQAEMGDRFQIENPWFKKYAYAGHLVELRIDSPRFSAHPDAPAECPCELCNEPAAKPILCHEEPASLVALPEQQIPSRGWGEQFWAKIIHREGEYLSGVIDNRLYETRLHDLQQGDEITFHEDHILVVHGVHRDEIMLSMNASDLEQFGEWLQSKMNEPEG